MTKTISEKENLPNLKSNGRFTIICIIVLLAGLWAGKLINEDNSQQICMENGHSFDTCHWSLNR